MKGLHRRNFVFPVYALYIPCILLSIYPSILYLYVCI